MKRRHRLESLGFHSYDEYLRSPHWADLKVRYRKSDLPQACLACGERRYELHHRTYARLGNESFWDVIPLCRGCHDAVHDFARERRYPLCITHVILQKLNGWTRDQTRAKMRPFARHNPKRKKRAASLPSKSVAEEVARTVRPKGPHSTPPDPNSKRQRRLAEIAELRAQAAKAEVEPPAVCPFTPNTKPISLVRRGARIIRETRPC